VRPPGLIVYEPEAWLPTLHRPEWLGRLTFDTRLRHARHLLTSRGCTKIILYLWRPEFAPALASIPFDLSCYHIVDEYSFSAAEVPVDTAEVKLIAEVDQVFIHSPGLLERLGSRNPNTALIPNGVDYQSFATTAAEPRDLAPIPRPRIGYNGFIKQHLDWVLLDTLTERHREWSFVFVGPVMPHPQIFPLIEQLSRRDNVHFLGAKSIQELTAYPQHFDVCIMPYALSDYSAQFIYPLKLHEYLASGSPVVGTRIRSLERFADVVSLAVTPDEWSMAISSSLRAEENSESRRSIRQAVAKEHDWDVLVEQIATTFSKRVDCTARS
jgi:glycosyltransferase involved in cell wall biosynthesis